MTKAKGFVALLEDEAETVSDPDINGLVAEFVKHSADALSALSKVQTVAAKKGNLYISVQAKELIDEFGKFWKKSKYFREKYRDK